MSNKDEVAYYTEYVDETGLQHYAIHLYNRVTGYVTMFKDLRFC